MSVRISLIAIVKEVLWFEKNSFIEVFYSMIINLSYCSRLPERWSVMSMSCPAISCLAFSLPAILMVRHFYVLHFQSCAEFLSHLLSGALSTKLDVDSVNTHSRWIVYAAVVVYVLHNRYVWHKDGLVLEPFSSLQIRQVDGTSTVYIESPSRRHEGFYQCFASNTFGTAVSVKSLLRKASTLLAIMSL